MYPQSDYGQLSDEERLASFLDDVHEILDQIVGDERLFVEGTHEDVVALWEETRGLIPTVQRTLRGQDADLEGPPPLDARLERAGLTGNSLRVKLSVFDKLWDRLKRRWTPKRIVGVLGVVNSMLGSLATAIGAAEPLKEAKEIVEGLFDVAPDDDGE